MEPTLRTARALERAKDGPPPKQTMLFPTTTPLWHLPIAPAGTLPETSGWDQTGTSPSRVSTCTSWSSSPLVPACLWLSPPVHPPMTNSLRWCPGPKITFAECPKRGHGLCPTAVIAPHRTPPRASRMASSKAASGSESAKPPNRSNRAGELADAGRKVLVWYARGEPCTPSRRELCCSGSTHVQPPVERRHEASGSGSGEESGGGSEGVKEEGGGRTRRRRLAMAPW
mmetsp:Transcript_63092/g.148601  ORF Transcript_63092/g.148601 Transcript_63092/m.148601 type:complete len:228 (-) Transcript_63092:141-824(-)